MKTTDKIKGIKTMRTYNCKLIANGWQRGSGFSYTETLDNWEYLTDKALSDITPDDDSDCNLYFPCVQDWEEVTGGIIDCDEEPAESTLYQSIIVDPETEESRVLCAIWDYTINGQEVNRYLDD